MKVGQQVTVCDYHGTTRPYNAKVVTLYTIEELGASRWTKATAGEIVCFSGIENVTIRRNAVRPEHGRAAAVRQDLEPTVEMASRSTIPRLPDARGKFVTSRHLRERLFRRLLKDVSLRVQQRTDTTDSFRVYGRGRCTCPS